jgi:hypothetical protein
MSTSTLKPFSEVIDALTALATEYPDRQAQCQYFDVAIDCGDDEFPPSSTACCIVGHFLASKGVTRIRGGELQLNGVRITEEGTSVKDVDWSALGYRQPGVRQRDWAETLQTAQDNGDVWGDALKETQRAVRL